MASQFCSNPSSASLAKNAPIFDVKTSELICSSLASFFFYLILFFVILGGINALNRLGFGAYLAKLWRSRLTMWRVLVGASISAHEVGASIVAASMAGLIMLGAVATASEDDILDSAALGIFALVCALISSAIISLGALLTYVATPVGSVDAWRKVVFDDLVNFALYALRIFLCWTRYIFYDLQVESVDMALQLTDTLFENITLTNVSALEGLVWVAFDVVASVIQLSLSLVKLFLAAFLLWLVVDLFLLRPLVRCYTRWALRR